MAEVDVREHALAASSMVLSLPEPQRVAFAAPLKAFKGVFVAGPLENVARRDVESI